jgi:hypothetical protein
MTAALRLPPSLLLTVLSGIALATPAVLLAQSTPPATSRALELDPVEVLGLPILEEL